MKEMENNMRESSQRLFNYINILANTVEEIKASLCVFATKSQDMASAVKINRSHLIANDTTMHLTRKHIQQIDSILQEITGCLDNTTAGLETKLEVLQEITTDNIAEMTTAMNSTNRDIQKNMELLAQKHTQEIREIHK
jgi:predicted transcriptional regulator